MERTTCDERSTITNLKAVLIMLVVVGHFCQLIPSYGGIKQGIILWIYSFHMPAFVLVSGYLSKNVEKRREKAFADLFIPFIVFQLVYGLINVTLTGHSVVTTNLLHPEWGLWYLLALFVWRYSLPDVIRIRGAVWVSIIVSILTGYLPKVGNAFAAQRTFGFFCLFLVGYYCKRDAIEKTKRIRPIWGVLGLISGLAFFMSMMGLDKLNYSTWLHVFTHQAVYEPAIPWRVGVDYLMALLIAAFSAVLLLVAVPRSENRCLRKLGDNTLAIYLSHTVVFLVGRKYVPLVNNPTMRTAAVACLIAACLVLFTRRSYVQAFSRFLDLCKKLAMKGAKETGVMRSGARRRSWMGDAESGQNSQEDKGDMQC